MTTVPTNPTPVPTGNGHAADAARWIEYADPETPPDLLPRTGNDAYQRTSCTSIFLTDVPGATDLKHVSDGLQIDLSDQSGALNLFRRPAEGLILTTEQSWFARGVTLGQLMHSLALAPGEATRIAVVDWTRRTSGSDTGTDTQTDTSAAATDRGRSISDVAHALAQEEQHGETVDTADSVAASMSASASYSGLVWSGSASLAAAYSHDTATHVSRASGTRNLSSENAQRLSDRTEQQATALRSRRATVVQETAQAGSTQVSTRIVANYNHTRALSVQYYEVVQAFEVRTRTRRIERCLFLPMKLQDFAEPAGLRLLKRHHLLFAAVAPPAWQDRFRDYDPTAFTVVRCSAAARLSTTGNGVKVGPVGSYAKGSAFDWDRPETSAREVVVSWDGDKVRAVSLTMSDGQQFSVGTGGYSWDTVTFDQGDVMSRRPATTVRSIKITGSGWDSGAIGSVVLASSEGKTVQARQGDVNAAELVPPESGMVITGLHGWVDSKDGWTYPAALGFHLRPTRMIVTPFETLAGQQRIERLEFWFDTEKICAIRLALADHFTSTYGDPDPDPVGKGYTHKVLDLGADDRLVRLVVRTTQAGAQKRAEQEAVGQVVIQTTAQPSPFTVGATVAPPMGWAAEQALDVPDGDLLSVFGTAALVQDEHFFTALGFTVRVPRTPPQPLLEHLQDNALYYNQALWAGADPLSLAGALANVTYEPPGPAPVPASSPAYWTVRAVGAPRDGGGTFDGKGSVPVSTVQVWDDGSRLVGIRMITWADGVITGGTLEESGGNLSQFDFLPDETVESVTLVATSDGEAPMRLELTTSRERTFVAGPAGGTSAARLRTAGQLLMGCFGSAAALPRDTPEGSDTSEPAEDPGLLTSLGLWLAPRESVPDLPRPGQAVIPQPLAACIDPVPIAMTQNYLGFRWHFPTEEARKAWLAAEGHKEGPSTEVPTEVSLPTGGLFAEAVLGRSVAAERLDLTRFWNWQDSPIPFPPTDIAPPSTSTGESVVTLSRPDAAPTSAVAPAPQDLPQPAAADVILAALNAQKLIDPALITTTPSVSRAGAVLNAALAEQAKRADAAAKKTEKAQKDKKGKKDKKAKDAASNGSSPTDQPGTDQAGTDQAGTEQSDADGADMSDLPVTRPRSGSEPPPLPSEAVASQP